jgi:hypothetical protein
VDFKWVAIKVVALWVEVTSVVMAMDNLSVGLVKETKQLTQELEGLVLKAQELILQILLDSLELLYYKKILAEV